MIKTEAVKLSSGVVSKVTEISFRELLNILPVSLDKEKKNDGTKEEKDDVKSAFFDKSKEFMKKSCGLKSDEMLDLVSSDYEKLWEAFKEVNSFFFKVADNLSLGTQLRKAILSLMNGVGDELVSSLKQDIRAALTTDSASLSKQSSSTEKTEEDES